MTRKPGLVWLLLLFCTAVRASNLRQISSREGISNNAILSLAQDKHGFIWVGSCDGLNMWDGERMRLFPNDWGGETPLSGNLIEEIAVTTDSLFWIRTNYGLDLFDPDSKRVERHADFQGMYKIVTRRSDEVLVVTQDNKFSCYDPAARRFSSVQPMSGIDYADILDMQLDDDGALWVFSRKGIFRIPVAFPDKNNDRIGIEQPERFPTVSNPEYAFAENGSGFFIDENHIFYEFDIRERRLIYNKDMSDEMARMGSVSSIVRDGGDYIVSFYTNGVIRLRTTPEQSVKYATEHINIPCGVFSLLRDARQAPTDRDSTSIRATPRRSARSPSTNCPTTSRNPSARSTSTTSGRSGSEPKAKASCASPTSTTARSSPRRMCNSSRPATASCSTIRSTPLPAADATCSGSAPTAKD